MSKEAVVFITHKTFVDLTLPEGGVRLCTLDYIDLLKEQYDVHVLAVDYNRSLSFRFKSRLGLDAYEEYDPAAEKSALDELFLKKGVTKAFINLSNAMQFAAYIKSTYGEAVKTILCSHGNESGDFLHQSVRFRKQLPFARRVFSTWRLGKILQKESSYRQQHLDCVLTVSEVEFQIEKWLGARQAFMVPRVFSNEFLDWKPIPGRVGFVGDIRHEPNFYGMLKLCEAVAAIGNPGSLQIRLVGTKNQQSEDLAARFSFVSITGYLNDAQFKEEAATWNYYLNLVFYYSKGVSTKLQKGINWGLPIISTTAGNRGYDLKGGSVITVDRPEDMAQVLLSRLSSHDQIADDRKETVKLVENSITYREIMDELHPMLTKL